MTPVLLNEAPTLFVNRILDDVPASYVLLPKPAEGTPEVIPDTKGVVGLAVEPWFTVESESEFEAVVMEDAEGRLPDDEPWNEEMLD